MVGAFTQLGKLNFPGPIRLLYKKQTEMLLNLLFFRHILKVQQNIGMQNCKGVVITKYLDPNHFTD
jgi:hypothetical protein